MIRRKGLTLIEVVVSLVLLATVATSLLHAQSNALAQIRATEHADTAAGLARELIVSWKTLPETRSHPSEGSFAGEDSWSWSRTVRPYSGTPELTLTEVTLTIRRSDERGVAHVFAEYAWLEQLDEKL